MQYFYFREKYYFCLLQPYKFHIQLEKVVLNDLPTSQIEIPIKTFKKSAYTILFIRILKSFLLETCTYTQLQFCTS